MENAFRTIFKKILSTGLVNILLYITLIGMMIILFLIL